MLLIEVESDVTIGGYVCYSLFIFMYAAFQSFLYLRCVEVGATPLSWAFCIL